MLTASPNRASLRSVSQPVPFGIRDLQFSAAKRRGGLRLPARQREPEAAPFAQLAVHTDAAAVCLDR